MTLDSVYFDGWYTDMAAAPTRDAILARAMGMPAELQDAGALLWQGLAEVTAALRLTPGDLLADIACGRGGYGIGVAQSSGAHLIGVDFSAVAVHQATANSARLLPAGRATFQTGTLLETGLPTGSVDALMCVDAVQFGEPPLAALTEFRRLLKPGGRLAVTCWEAVDPADEQVPSRIHAVDLRRDLTKAGFADVQVREMPTWRQAEREMWEAAVAAPDADAAMRALQAEGRRSLDTFDAMRRVFATGTAP
ncbi:class I SAM-dependent methyltransferase [Actinoplanes sp. NPDC051494]|uniref:class I SAM-dependent methyltransferase n=1 Tax=Actinoplanes sp. NPDC051494 TaxID=3363907 RepID=UPI0037B0864E